MVVVAPSLCFAWLLVSVFCSSWASVHTYLVHAELFFVTLFSFLIVLPSNLSVEEMRSVIVLAWILKVAVIIDFSLS